MLKRALLALLLLIIMLLTHTASIYWNWFGQHSDAGMVSMLAIPPEVIKDKAARLNSAGANRQILFGDLHVHTTFSKDAFIMSLPILSGGGAHPPADACDFARYCAGLDFWGISDHAEGLTPEHWRETIDSIEQCNAVAGDAGNPDMVSFLGWEWSQAGDTAAEHYGHKNVFFLDTASDRVPARPIGSAVKGMPGSMVTGLNTLLSLVDFGNRQYYYNHQQFLQEYTTQPPCAEDVPVRELPAGCVESAKTPALLNAKLDEWGYDSLIIPHGNAWGITTPIGADFASQLNPADFNPARERLIEIFSGHGNSEEYRPWREVSFNEKGERRCPAASPRYLPGCVRAGELIYQRCINANEATSTCEQRRTEAQQHYIDAGLLKGFLTVPGASIDDWGNADQCEDCFLPAFNYIPRSSAQYAMAISNFDGDKPLRYRFGFIGSSDNHAGKAGSGYKEFDRVQFSESRNVKYNWINSLTTPNRGEPASTSVPPNELASGLAMDRERYSAFTLTGGLIAVHSDSRRREDIWHAMKQRQVYATSGPQILLWFDLLRGEDSLPMGSEINSSETPRFRVRAAGSFKQQPGCPDYSTNALGKDRLQQLCRGECFYPGNERHRIERIEIIRIRPQQFANEPVNELIEDPWRSFDCPPNNEGCVVEFDDPEYSNNGRDTLYYARALQQATEMVNGEPFACEEQDTNGDCIRYRRCDFVNYPDDQCLGKNRERAWSSPLFINFPPSDGGRSQ